jgi:hypothetical protein
LKHCGRVLVIASQRTKVPIVLNRASERKHRVRRVISGTHFCRGIDHIANKKGVNMVKVVIVILSALEKSETEQDFTYLVESDNDKSFRWKFSQSSFCEEESSKVGPSICNISARC